MAKNKPFKGGGSKRDGGMFLALPLSVLKSVAYINASAHARMLLFDLFMQYRGDNNGDFCAAWKVMRPRGWKSPTTLQKAKRSLIELGLICETRKGARPNKASLYALTWLDLDYCGGKLDISGKAFPRSAYLQSNPMPLIHPKNARLNTPAVVMVA